jgi:glyoxylase-like metal-dependent hydrolase (beta-lactamase superfamily II)
MLEIAGSPGDMTVWLPQAQVAFAGDVVYGDRLLPVLPVNSTKAWLEAFAVLEQLAPLRIVPGHGGVTDLAAAPSQTPATPAAPTSKSNGSDPLGHDMRCATVN